ncbi:M16 family metallopeptidase [Haloimpatiens sp. FM7315]|uniref:M16 family metallopeptidase n=1 Tax=Haloimpatiens sp. FM7315 TaxID=3298609 RepID=UPI0035A33109
MKKYFDSRDTILENGLRIISIKKETRIASINIGFKIGSIYEKENEKGICHFIEHMLFKGTVKRTNDELNDELEQIGGEYNAYTDYISTVYSITALCEEVENSIEILSDMTRNSVFDEKELDRERGVILAEIRGSKDDIEDYSFERINQMAFKKSALKFDTVGEESTVKNFKQENLKEFYEKNYVPNNCSIVVVSSLDHEKIIELVEKYFANWKRKKLENREFIIEDNSPIKKVTIKKDIEQSTIMYLYTFYNLPKEMELILKILNHRFGESANSILFRELREKRGLAYDVYTNMDLTKGVKTLYIYTAVAKKDVDKTLKIIDRCIEDIKKEKIVFDNRAIDLMKKILKTSVAATIEDSEALCSYILGQALCDEDIFEFEKDISDLQNIDKKDLYDVARRVFIKPTVHVLVSEDEDL